MRINKRQADEALDRRVIARVLMEMHPFFDQEFAAMDAVGEIVFEIRDPGTKLRALGIRGGSKDHAQITRQETVQEGPRANAKFDVEPKLLGQLRIGDAVIRDLAGKFGFNGHVGTIGQYLVLTDYSHARAVLGGKQTDFDGHQSSLGPGAAHGR